MLSLKPCKSTYYQLPTFLPSHSKLQRVIFKQAQTRPRKLTNLRPCATSNSAGQGDGGETKSERRTFLTLEEAGLIEMSGLDSHERFLCRLTVSSLNLLRVISEQEGCPIEELNAGKLCDWFVKDKLKRERNIDSAVLQWDDSGFQI